MRKQVSFQLIGKIVASCLVLLVLKSSAQVKPCDLLSPEKLRSDLDTLYETIVASHPRPGGFSEQTDFQQYYDSLRNTLNDSLNPVEFSERIAGFLNSMHDSHTSPDYGQMQQWSFQMNGYVVPFSCFSEGEKIYIHHDWEEKIPRGSQILSVNGCDIAELRSKAISYACIEGNAVVPQIRVADAILPVLVSIHSPADSVNTFQVISSASGLTETYTLKGLTEKEFKKKKKERMELKENKILDFYFNEDNSVATLKVGTFAPSNPRTYRKFIKNAFRVINLEKCDSLVIDLRGNGGGSSSQVEYLYSFMDTAGYNTPSNIIAVKSDLALKRSKALTKKPTIFILRNFFRKNEDVSAFLKMVDLPHGGRDTAYFREPVSQKDALVFTGSSVLLINGLTASAGVDFTHAFKSKNRGLIIGEPCLGPSTGTWGNPAAFVLPNSMIRVSISTIRYNYDDSFIYDPSPIVPDVEIHPSPAMARDKKDEVLEYIKNGW